MDRSTIENVLLEIGIPAGIKGFRYITDAILILDDDPDIGMTKELYPVIAEKNNTTDTRVERAIRHAFAVARSSKENYDAVEYYIGFMNCENGNSLKMLHMRIRQKYDSVDKQVERTTEGGIDENKIREIIREELKAIMGGIV